ncbi:MAG: 2Fe-2S iron-sulfur cluster-binding protein [Pseudolabrys sp.]
MTATQPTLALNLLQRDEVAANIHQFVFESATNDDLPPFTAGAHIALQVPNGALRKYALCGDPADGAHYSILVRREDGGSGGTASLIDQARAGTTFAAVPPVNDFELPRNAQNLILIAGGIGIAPIMAMVRQLAAEPGKSFKLYYLVRSRDVAAFSDELAAPEFKGKVVVHYDGDNPDKYFDFWPVLETRKDRAHIYCCGPREMMEAVRDMSGHWPHTAVHFMSFVDAAAAKADDKPFTVKLAKSGDVVEVPVGTTILEALRAAGHEAPSSCESGTCGTCRTKLIEGEADHRDLVLTDDERASNIMICVSRAKSPQLVIDR